MPVLAHQPVQFHDVRPKGRDFVLGDLHGCMEAFWTLLEHVQFNLAQDRVFAVGDLVDRGPDSWACLSLLGLPWFFSCLGNHEAMLVRHLQNPVQRVAYDTQWLLQAGGDRQEMAQLAEIWVPRLEALPAVHVVGQGTQRFNVVHAELLEEGRSVTDAMIDAWSFSDPAKALERATYGRALANAWDQRLPTRRAHDAQQMSPTYCGHTILPQPAWINRQAYIDGGAFLGYQRHGLDEGELRSQGGPARPGLVLVEPRTKQAWICPTDPRRVPQVLPLTLAVRELR